MLALVCTEGPMRRHLVLAPAAPAPVPAYRVALQSLVQGTITMLSTGKGV